MRVNYLTSLRDISLELVDYKKKVKLLEPLNPKEYQNNMILFQNYFQVSVKKKHNCHNLFEILDFLISISALAPYY